MCLVDKEQLRITEEPIKCYKLYKRLDNKSGLFSFFKEILLTSKELVPNDEENFIFAFLSIEEFREISQGIIDNWDAIKDKRNPLDKNIWYLLECEVPVNTLYGIHEPCYDFGKHSLNALHQIYAEKMIITDKRFNELCV